MSEAVVQEGASQSILGKIWKLAANFEVRHRLPTGPRKNKGKETGVELPKRKELCQAHARI